jgi:uncharacterized protein YraI
MMKLTISAAIAGLAMSSAAFAETRSTASTDLNLRAGPGPNYEILSVIPADGDVIVEGCLADSNWCRVTHEGTDGWAFGEYLTARGDAAEDAPVATNRDRLDIATITYERGPSAAVPGGIGGAITGALLGGPIGAAIGAGVGAGLGSQVRPEERVTTYIRTNPVDPVFLEGEVVVGAGIPEGVMLREVPESEFYYAYVNGVPVLVERENRRVVYIVR